MFPSFLKCMDIMFLIATQKQPKIAAKILQINIKPRLCRTKIVPTSAWEVGRPSESSEGCAHWQRRRAATFKDQLPYLEKSVLLRARTFSLRDIRAFVKKHRARRLRLEA